MLPPTEPRDNYIPGPPSIDPAHAGRVTLDKTGPFEAGSYQTITLTYTAGRYGIDDTGSLKIVTRFANDQGQPQFENPGAPNYVTVHASNNAVLDVRFAPKLNTRPYEQDDSDPGCEGLPAGRRNHHGRVRGAQRRFS